MTSPSTSLFAQAAAGAPPKLIGMIHLPPLPGSPRYAGDPAAALRSARADLDALARGGADGAIIENLGDAPYFPVAVPAFTVAAMSVVVADLRARVPDGFLLGINVLRNDAAAALSVAVAAGASFIRVNVHVGVAVADQGLLEGKAHETLRLRETLRARDSVSILADVGVKHATPLGGRPIDEEARDAVERGFASALLVTGPRTGEPVAVEDLVSVRRACPATPLFAASGVTADRVADLVRYCDGFIVGTWIKRDGRIDSAVDEARVRLLSSQLRRIRAS